MEKKQGKMEKLGHSIFGFDFTSNEDTVKEVKNFKIRMFFEEKYISVKYF